MPRFNPILASLLALAALLPTARSAQAAESFDNCAGTISSLPATISTQGMWCLKKDLSTAITSGNAILINANNVTIDCNDFKLGGLAAGDGSQANGIYAHARQNATIRHCGIRGFNRGIYLNGGAGHLVEDNRLDNNLNIGILVYGDNNLVEHNRIYDTGGYTDGTATYRSATGIFGEADVVDNTIDGVTVAANATSNTIAAIYLFDPSDTVRGNRIHNLITVGSGSTMYGIYAFNNNSIVDNQVSATYYGTVSASGFGIG